MATSAIVRTLGTLALSQAFAFAGAQGILRGLVVYEGHRSAGPPAGWLVPLNAAACLAMGMAIESGRRTGHGFLVPGFALAALAFAHWGRFGGLPSFVFPGALSLSGLATLAWGVLVRRNRVAVAWTVPFVAWLIAVAVWVR